MFFFPFKVSLTGRHLDVKVIFAGRNGAIKPVAESTPGIVTHIKIQDNLVFNNVTLFKIKIAPAAVAFRAIGQVFEGQKKVIAISGVLYQANILVNIKGLRLSVYFKLEDPKLHIIPFLAAVSHHDEGFGVWSSFKFLQKTPGFIGRKKVEKRRIGSRQGLAGFA